MYLALLWQETVRGLVGFFLKIQGIFLITNACAISYVASKSTEARSYLDIPLWFSEKREGFLLGSRGHTTWLFQKKPERLEKDSPMYWGANHADVHTVAHSGNFIMSRDDVANWSSLCRQHSMRQRRQSCFPHNSKTGPGQDCSGLPTIALLFLSSSHTTAKRRQSTDHLLAFSIGRHFEESNKPNYHIYV